VEGSRPAAEVAGEVGVVGADWDGGRQRDGGAGSAALRFCKPSLGGVRARSLGVSPLWRTRRCRRAAPSVWCSACPRRAWHLVARCPIAGARDPRRCGTGAPQGPGPFAAMCGRPRSAFRPVRPADGHLRHRSPVSRIAGRSAPRARGGGGRSCKATFAVAARACSGQPNRIRSCVLTHPRDRGLTCSRSQHPGRWSGRHPVTTLERRNDHQLAARVSRS
jgi:hypothetical protein